MANVDQPSAPAPAPAPAASPTAVPAPEGKPAPAAHAHPNYIGIFLALAVLTAIELGVAFLPFPKMTVILMLIGLAVWKAALVALYYMHLRFEPNRVRILALAPLPLAVILVITVTREYRW